MRLYRGAQALVVAVAALAVVASTAAPVQAAPPNRTQTPVITTKPSSPTNATTATFSFSSGSAGAVFTCALDGGAATTCTSPWTYSGVGGGAHTFSVKAQAPGLKASGTATASWTVDTNAPGAPTVTGPTAVTKDTSPVITFSSAATDVAGYRCSLDGAVAAACTSGSAVPASAEGGHLFTVTAIDTAGNVSAPTTIAWTLDTVVSTPVVLSGPLSLTSVDSATFSFLSPDTDAATECSLDGAAFAGCSSPVTYSAVGVGVHTFRVRATDPAANTATSDTVTWTRGATPVTFGWSDPSSLPSALTNETGATFAFDLAGHTTVACSLDGTALPSCTSPLALSDLGGGAHSLVLSIDQGLGTASTVAYHWEIDLVAPAQPLLTAPTGTVASKSATIGVSAGSASDRLTCLVDGSLTPCTTGSTLELVDLAEGDHTVTVTAADRAGNVSTSSVTWAVDTLAPVHTVTFPTSITGAVRVVFNDLVTGAAANPTLSVLGGAAVATTRTCYADTTSAVPCTFPVRTVVLQPVSRLVPGQSYAVQVNPAGSAPVADLAGNAAATATSSFRAALVQQEDSAAIAQTWRTVSATAARNGSYTTENRKGAKAVFTFTGTTFTVYPVSGPGFGYVDVFVDGVKKASWNQYAATTGFKSVRSIKGLPSGKHTVSLVVTGKRGSTKAKGAAVGIDAIAFAGTVQKTPKLTASWARVKSYGALGYYRAVAGLPGQALSMSFVGTGVTWTYNAGKASGKAYVYIDGVKKATIDQFSSTARDRVTWSITGLAPGTHSIRIVATGTKRSTSTGTSISVDALTVR